MDHLAAAKNLVSEEMLIAPTLEHVDRYTQEAIAHALIAICQRLDKLTACVEQDSRMFRTKPFDIR